MAIRFLCRSCSQPIEVDDEWASKLVACPFCRTTLTAPNESQFQQPTTVPTAAGIPEATAVTEPAPAARRDSATNKVAIAAVILACCVIGQYSAFVWVLSQYRVEIENFQAGMDERVKSGQTLMEAQRLAVLELLEESEGAVPTWFMVTPLLMMGMGACWLAAVTCGIIGARRAFRRNAAVSALVFCSIFPFVACCGAATT